MKTLAVVTSVGARTPIGLNAKHTGFLYRASAAAMTEAALLDPNEEPVTMCVMPTLDPLLVGAGRAFRLAIPALEEALGNLGPVARELRTKIIVCVDEHLAVKRPDGVIPAAVVAELLRKRAEELVQQIELETCARGPAGPGFALPDDLERLASGKLDAVILGGVHSDYDPAVIAALHEANRLFTPENLDSIVPGESAAFAVLMRPDVARRFGLPAHANLHAVASAFEKARPDNDESAYEAIGMTVALRKAATELIAEKGRAGWMLNDMAFEMLRVHELQAIAIRTQEIWCEPQRWDFPAQRLGNLGAAAMPLEIALAAEAWRHGYAPHAIAFAFAGSDGGERAVMLLSDGR